MEFAVTAEATIISIRVSVPVLSEQMRDTEPERLDGRQSADDGVALRHALHADRERDGDQRRQALGNDRDRDADDRLEGLDEGQIAHPSRHRRRPRR